MKRMDDVSYDKPYAGLKVVDLSQAVAGPYAAALLAQMGADVIKIEPQRGDWVRWLGGTYGDHSPLSIVANLGKRSIVVDPKTAEGQAIVLGLVTSADVFIESFRPGVMTRLGFGCDAVAALNPRIIYLAEGRAVASPSGTYETADGFINLAIIYDHEFPVLCDLLGLAEFRDHPDYRTVAQRHANRDALNQALQKALICQGTDYWCERLAEARLLHEKVNSYADFMVHPQTMESGALAWVEHPETGTIPLANPPGVTPHGPENALRAPGLGEHTREILSELGYSPEQIDTLTARGVVGVQSEALATGE